MRRFHGDLLVGGLTLHEIDGVIEHECPEPARQEGHFEVDAEQHALLELNRPYLLRIDDGESMKLVVKGIDQSSDDRRLVVQFESM